MSLELPEDAADEPPARLPPVQDEIPARIVPSLYARVHGEEPFDRKSNQEWELHTIPTNEWVDKAKDKISRCPLPSWPEGDEQEGAPSSRTSSSSGAPHGDITWVSILLDLKRGESGNGQFQRTMQEYYDRFQRVIDRGFPMVIFIPKDFEEHLRIDKKRIRVIHFTAEDLKKYFPYYDRLTAVRTSDVWNRQAKATGWLAEAPQARLPLYDPLVMSKINLLRDAARLNPFSTKYVMFMDAGHYCAVGLEPNKMPVYERHMSKAFFLTHWPYATATEVHGMLDKAMHLYMGTAKDPLRIVRGGVFGGTRAYIECVAKVYNVALAQTLRDGYLGTEENIFAMIFKRFPELFAGFDNNSLGNHGDNCASFQKNEMEVQKAARQ